MNDKTPEETARKEYLFNYFAAVGATYQNASWEQRCSDTAYMQLIAAHAMLNGTDAGIRIKEQIPVPKPERFDTLDDVRSSIVGFVAGIENVDYASFQRVYASSMIIASFTRFDALLSDITQFLVLMHPNIMKDRQVSVASLFSHSTISEAVNGAVSKYINELAYKPYKDRLKAMNDNFGMGIDLNSEKIKAVQKHAEVRNAIVHEGGGYTFTLDDSIAGVKVTERARSVVPTWKMAEEVGQDCRYAANEIFVTVARKLFGREYPIDFLRAADTEPRTESSKSIDELISTALGGRVGT